MSRTRSGRATSVACAGLAWALLALTGCMSLTPEEAAAKLDRALAEAVTDDPDVHGAAMWVDAPRLGLQAGFAHGLADTRAGTPMTVDTPFYSASVGKLFVATAVHALAAAGRLSLDDPLTKWVPLEEVAGLPVTGGDAALARVTVRMLLGHTSGLPDYFSGPSADGAPRLFELLAREPTRTWTRQDLLDYTRAHYAAAGAPGERFEYADTNYDLLGLVLEKVEGKPFHLVVREQVLVPLGLSQTWYHSLEQPPVPLPPVAEVRVGAAELRGVPALSADQAGGGLITTLGDLRLFVRQLRTARPVPLSALAEGLSEDAMHDGIDVGVGAWRIRPSGVFFALAGTPELVGHSGATGVWAYAVPDYDAVLVGAVSQSTWQEKHLEFLLSEVMPVLRRLPQPQP